MPKKKLKVVVRDAADAGLPQEVISALQLLGYEEGCNIPSDNYDLVRMIETLTRRGSAGGLRVSEIEQPAVPKRTVKAVVSKGPEQFELPEVIASALSLLKYPEVKYALPTPVSNRADPIMVRMFESLLEDNKHLPFRVAEFELAEDEVFVVNQSTTGKEYIEIAKAFEGSTTPLKVVLRKNLESELSEQAIQTLEQLGYKGAIDSEDLVKDNPLYVKVVEHLGDTASIPPGSLVVRTIDVCTQHNQYWVFESDKKEYASGDASEFHLKKGRLISYDRSNFEALPAVAELKDEPSDNEEEQRSLGFFG